MAPPARAGVVLAGGFATRFEAGDKTLATLDGRPLLAHAIDGVAPAVDGVVVSCRGTQLAEFRPIFDTAPVPVAPAPDPVPDRGPVAGLATALKVVDAPWVAVVAGDMPFVDGDFLDWLFERAADTTSGSDGDRHGDSDGVVPEVDGHRQPTHAVYRTAALASAAESVLTNGDPSLRAVLNRLDVDLVPADTVRSRTTARTFVDVNTVGELDAAAAGQRDGREE